MVSKLNSKRIFCTKDPSLSKKNNLSLLPSPHYPLYQWSLHRSKRLILSRPLSKTKLFNKARGSRNSNLIFKAIILEKRSKVTDNTQDRPNSFRTYQAAPTLDKTGHIDLNLGMKSREKSLSWLKRKDDKNYRSKRQIITLLKKWRLRLEKLTHKLKKHRISTEIHQQAN